MMRWPRGPRGLLHRQHLLLWCFAAPDQRHLRYIPRNWRGRTHFPSRCTGGRCACAPQLHHVLHRAGISPDQTGGSGVDKGAEGQSGGNGQWEGGTRVPKTEAKAQRNTKTKSTSSTNLKMKPRRGTWRRKWANGFRPKHAQTHHPAPRIDLRRINS